MAVRQAILVQRVTLETLAATDLQVLGALAVMWEAVVVRVLRRLPLLLGLLVVQLGVQAVLLAAQEVLVQAQERLLHLR